MLKYPVRKYLGAFVLCIMFVSSINASAASIEWNNGEKGNIDLTITPGSGKCGNSMTWELDKSGCLTISGSGRMYEYYDDKKEEYISQIPWFEENENAAITDVKIENGVESISALAFWKTSIKELMDNLFRQKV